MSDRFSRVNSTSTPLSRGLFEFSKRLPTPIQPQLPGDWFTVPFLSHADPIELAESWVSATLSGGPLFPPRQLPEVVIDVRSKALHKVPPPLLRRYLPRSLYGRLFPQANLFGSFAAPPELKRSSLFLPETF